MWNKETFYEIKRKINSNKTRQPGREATRERVRYS